MLVGVVVSAVVQFVKKFFGTSPLVTVVTTVVLAVVGSVAVWTLNYYGYMEAFLQILTTAGAFYAFIVRNLEKGLENKKNKDGASKE